MSGLRAVAGRRTTSPFTWMTYSPPRLAACAMIAAGVHSGLKESCTRPARSRRSTKTTPPRSRRLCTQPDSVTRSPACSARNAPARCVLYSVSSDIRVIFPCNSQDQQRGGSNPECVCNPVGHLGGTPAHRGLVNFVGHADKRRENENQQKPRPAPGVLPAFDRQNA